MSHDAHNPTPHTPRPDPAAPDRLAAYPDGLLTGEDLRAFERELANDPALRAEVDTQRSIDTSLNRLFEPAHPISLTGHSNGVLHTKEQAPLTPPQTQSIHPPRLRIDPSAGTPAKV